MKQGLLEGKLDELVKAGILAEIPHAKGVICNQCEENCYIEPEIKHPRTVSGGSFCLLSWQNQS